MIFNHLQAVADDIVQLFVTPGVPAPGTYPYSKCVNPYTAKPKICCVTFNRFQTATPDVSHATLLRPDTYTPEYSRFEAISCFHVV